jgi:hypothetical protein
VKVKIHPNLLDGPTIRSSLILFVWFNEQTVQPNLYENAALVNS